MKRLISLYLAILAMALSTKGEVLLSKGYYLYDMGDSKALIDTILLQRTDWYGKEHMRLPDELTCNGVTYTIIGILPCAFGNDELSSIEEITLPKHLESIGRDNFRYMPNVRKVNVNPTLKSIHHRNFCDMPLLKSFEFPDGFCEFVYQCFSNTGLEELIIPPEMRTFYSGYYFGGMTCCDMPNLRKLDLGNLEVIMEDAFWNLPLITELAIPATCIRIDERSFINLPSLREVVFRKRNGDSIKFYDDLFRRCPQLNDIYVENKTPFEVVVLTDIQTTPDDVFKPENCRLHVPCGCKDVYADAPYWNRFGEIIDDVAGIDNVEADGTAEPPVEYFNLQGMPVASPSSGIFLEKRGKEVRKVVRQ